MTMCHKAMAAMSLLAALALAGCRQDMHNQPKFYPQRGTDFYVDGRSVRPQVENTVARSQMNQDSYFSTGLNNGTEGNTMPFPVTLELLHRGQERYNVYCTPCHSRVGNGAGMIVQRGYRPAGNFQDARLLAMPLGHFFSVITNGYGAMPDYSAQITPSDRWAVVAYIKALQLSQNAAASDVAAGQQVKPLAEIVKDGGFPAGFANNWSLPPTANVYGTPNNQDNGIPGQDKGANAGVPTSATSSTRSGSVGSNAANPGGKVPANSSIPGLQQQQ